MFLDKIRLKVLFRFFGMIYWLTVNQIVAGAAVIATFGLVLIELVLEFVLDREDVLSAQEYLPVFWEWEHHNLMYVLKGEGEFLFVPRRQ